MQFRSSALTLGTLASLVLLAACDSSTGGGAGDGDDLDNLAAAELLAPFAGTYDLQDDWRTRNGIDVDEAFLVVDLPGSDGTAIVTLFDQDDFDNCIIQSPETGTLKKDDFSDAVFLNGFADFEDAELSLSGDTLTIEFSEGGNFDRLSVVAEKFNGDLVDECE